MHKKLFIPGPTEVLADRLEKMATPQVGHRSKEYAELHGRVVPKLQKALYTDNAIILSTSSGTGLMEAAARNFTKKKVLVNDCGSFSNRWADIARKNGKEVDTVEVEWGKHIPTEELDKKLATGEYDALFYTHNETSTGVMNPIWEVSEMMKAKYPDIIWAVDSVSSMMGVKLPVDELGVDFLLASMQKAFALPSGLAVASISDKAIEYAKTVPDRGFYFNIDVFMKYAAKNNTPTTPAISHVYALDYQLDKILNDEGLENRWERHKEMAKVSQDWAREYFAIFSEEGYESLTVTCVKNTRKIDTKDLGKKLGEMGYGFADGYGKIKGETFRIGHMGDHTVEDVKEYLADIVKVLGL